MGPASRFQGPGSPTSFSGRGSSTSSRLAPRPGGHPATGFSCHRPGRTQRPPCHVGWTVRSRPLGSPCWSLPAPRAAGAPGRALPSRGPTAPPGDPWRWLSQATLTSGQAARDSRACSCSSADPGRERVSMGSGGRSWDGGCPQQGRSPSGPPGPADVARDQCSGDNRSSGLPCPGSPGPQSECSRPRHATSCPQGSAA
ncbi:hypothetical protein H1C71_041974 [Ictidomys tridecemlineatus]|nr:hypothetical protein H1C71_041974 [Ictidomys tridecemlineatus]